MARHLWIWLLCAVLVGLALAASALAQSPGACQGSNCVYLPLAGRTTPVDVRNLLVRNTPGARTLYPQVVATLHNRTGSAVCDLEVDATLRFPGQTAPVSGTGGVALAMPGEDVTVVLYSVFGQNLTSVSGEVTATGWRFADCDYAFLTQVSQVATVDGFYVSVTGVVRNDTPYTLRAIDVRLSPGTGFTDYSGATVSPTVLPPGASATYTGQLVFAFEPYPPTSFAVRAIGRHE